VIIESLEVFGERRQPAHESGAQQMGLGAKRTAAEPLIWAFGHEADQDFLRLLQIGQKQALELTAPVRVVREILELLQWQSQMPFADLLPERLRAAEKSVRQLLNLPGAEFFATQGSDELVDRRGAV
jgi:hypothetical protein